MNDVGDLVCADRFDYDRRVAHISPELGDAIDRIDRRRCIQRDGANPRTGQPLEHGVPD